MENIKISIIVAAYNIAEWLPRCIKSVIAQTHKNWELILIDDGSTDNTGMIADSFAKQDKRIIVVHQSNAGLVAVREKGILLATGEYVGFIDGDDAVVPDMYERLLNNALVYDADISHCGLIFLHNGKKEEYKKGTEEIILQNSQEAIRDLLSGRWMEPSLCNKLYKKTLLKDSCLNKKIIYNEDFLRNFVLFKRANRVVYQDFYGYQYWRRENSISNDGKIVTQTKGILAARKCVLDNSEGDIKQYAMGSLLGTVVNAVNCLTFCSDKEAEQLCMQCRKELILQKNNLKLLSKRQQIAALCIMISPTLHRWIYKVYRGR